MLSIQSLQRRQPATTKPPIVHQHKIKVVHNSHGHRASSGRSVPVSLCTEKNKSPHLVSCGFTCVGNDCSGYTAPSPELLQISVVKLWQHYSWEDCCIDFSGDEISSSAISIYYFSSDVAVHDQYLLNY